MMYLHRFSNMFGEPNKGVHAVRIPYLDWALTDTLLTIGLAYYSSHRNPQQSILAHLIFWLMIGWLIHTAFGVKTPLAW